ncbi:MAG: ATP-binding protein [Lachnospiraceae bacterium]|nr:ATP-binding protein [Lachnospiraceae bacterium]
MEYANQISEMINVFSPEPLKIDQMDEFYCNKTMEYRMSDKYNSPMEDIFDVCQEAGRGTAFLLLGHKGCGKSTELNRLSTELEEKGYRVKTIVCSMDLDLLNIVYSDLFILMGEALLQIAEECGCEIDTKILAEIADFWDEGTMIATSVEQEAISVEAGMSGQTPKILGNLLSVFAKLKADLKYNEETRLEYRKQISKRSSEWMRLLGDVSEEIQRQSNGKMPIIIFEDLDKLNPDDAWKVFYHYAAILSGMPFPIIYTFPIGLSYDTKFSALEAYFETKTLPMIKIETIEGEPYSDGINVIREIVEKRTNLHLFEENVLEKLIRYTGGSLRDLFHAINTSAKRAERRKSEVISMEDADKALEELKTSLTRRIEEKDYDFLINIYKGNKERIGDKQILLKMLQASVVLEYNGRRWHNVHPLVVKFFKEQGMIENVGE